jgi:GT2 family glycosyltransferase
VSVIICAYTEDRWDDVLAAIRSVQAQTVPAHELIVVIDYNPALLDRVRAAVTGVTVLENAGRRGLSGARNTGVEAASGVVVAFLDDDATAAPDWLERLAGAYAAEGQAYGRVLGVGGTITPVWAGGRPAWFPEEFDWVIGCTYRGMATTTAPVRNLIGCNMSFRREIFAAIGGFHTEFGRLGSSLKSCEETEFCIRARQRFAGGVFLHEPRASVDHRVPAGRGRFSYFRSRCYAEGQSKALVADAVGTDDGLSSERTYTVKTLPSGVVRGLTDAVVSRSPHGAARAGAIVAGLTITTAGYVAGLIAPRIAALPTERQRQLSDVAQRVRSGATAAVRIAQR